jgi:hypothetical protein
LRIFLIKNLYLFFIKRPFLIFAYDLLKLGTGPVLKLGVLFIKFYRFGIGYPKS